jgi:hypothetical protein
MTPPAPAETLSARLDLLDAHAADLAALGAELSDDAGLCLSTAGSLSAALSGDEGWAARTAAASWSSLLGVLAARTTVVAGMFASAAAAYRDADAELARRIRPRRPDARSFP